MALITIIIVVRRYREEKLSTIVAPRGRGCLLALPYIVVERKKEKGKRKKRKKDKRHLHFP